MNIRYINIKNKARKALLDREVTDRVMTLYNGKYDRETISAYFPED